MTDPSTAETLLQMWDGGRRTEFIRALLASDIEFSRSQVQVGLASDQATGRRLLPRETIDAFGEDFVAEVLREGSATLVVGPDEPARTLSSRRAALGLSTKRLAAFTHLSEREVEKAEKPGEVSPVRTIETLAEALALDETVVGFQPESGGDARLGVRLRELKDQRDTVRFTENAVLSLAEAAWVIGKQATLSNRIGERPKYLDLTKPDYRYDSPTWEHGYRLAERTRALLDIGGEAPVGCLRELIEERLGIPLIHQELGEKFAGATLANGNVRGIVVNVQGKNDNVWVRRMTLCHELGHLLWDPDERLNRLTVDSYEDFESFRLDGSAHNQRDEVEKRANAFAVAFLAPPHAVRELVDRQGARAAVPEIMRVFGISYSAAMAHVWNTTHASLDRIPSDEIPSVSDEWKARESYTVDYFPLPATPISRRGRFVRFVVGAVNDQSISWDTGASLLRTTVADLKSAWRDVVDLYPR